MKLISSILIWFSKEWWIYLLEKPFSWSKFWCRIKGHPEGVVWYNIGGLEPDMRCKNCKDNLG